MSSRKPIGWQQIVLVLSVSLLSIPQGGCRLVEAVGDAWDHFEQEYHEAVDEIQAVVDEHSDQIESDIAEFIEPVTGPIDLGDIPETKGEAMALTEDALAWIRTLEIIDYDLWLCVSNQVGELSDTVLTEVQSLSCRGKGIRNLAGLQHFPNLKYLSLDHNQISDLRPLAGLNHLETLQLGFNAIRDVSPLAALPSLKTVNLTNNQVDAETLPALAGVATLENLQLYGNPIRDLMPLRFLTQIKGLGLGNTGVQDVQPLITLGQLIWLDLDSNGISSLETAASAMQYMSNLIYVSFQNNQIQDVSPLGSVPQLLFLDLSGNAITDVSGLASLIRLSQLDLSNNLIQMGVSRLVTLTAANLINLFANNNAPCAELTTLSAAFRPGVVIRPAYCAAPTQPNPCKGKFPSDQTACAVDGPATR